MVECGIGDNEVGDEYDEWWSNVASVAPVPLLCHVPPKAR